jgi:hypothetical protein
MKYKMPDTLAVLELHVVRFRITNKELSWTLRIQLTISLL